MVITRTIGKPGLFITFTANPFWPEIIRCLEHGQSSDACPDVVAIIFKLKLDASLHDLKDRNIFGKCVGDVYTIGYQKRGLPHAHILYLHSDDIPNFAKLLDKLVSAQIPTDDPVLAAIVKNQMTHGMCSADHPNSYCFRDGKCSKAYPKRCCETTIVGEDSYSEYTLSRMLSNLASLGKDKNSFVY